MTTDVHIATFIIFWSGRNNSNLCKNTIISGYWVFGLFQPRLVETLISAEKHSTDGHSPGNAYRKLLVCDLLPLLAKKGVRVELSSKMLYKLLHKAIEFYLCCLGLSTSAIQVRVTISTH